MQQRHVSRSRAARVALVSAGILALSVGAAACSAFDRASRDPWSEGRLGVTLITEDPDDPFFVAMEKGARAGARTSGMALTVASGRQRGDDAAQVAAIEEAVRRGDRGIVITPASGGVGDALRKARDAGLYVIALDTPPDPAEAVDITFATDDREMGHVVGAWAASMLAGRPAGIALLDPVDDVANPGGVGRVQGFLEGLGIDVADPTRTGDEARTGTYTGGRGGGYTIACDVSSAGPTAPPSAGPSAAPGAGPSAGPGAGVSPTPAPSATDAGGAAMQACLAKDETISVVYADTRSTAVGAATALRAAGVTDAIIVSVDGGCAGIASVEDGTIGATAEQDPERMATLGVEAIGRVARGGEKPRTSEGLDVLDTGVTLVTDQPSGGLESTTSGEALTSCWG